MTLLKEKLKNLGFEPHEKNLNICYFGGRKSFSLVDWEEVIAALILFVKN